MNNDINEKIVHAAPVPPFVRFVASAVPMVFDNSLSYYEALCALWKWMQDNLVDVINNNATVTEHYIDLDLETRSLFNQLKTYVDTYFDNLDVQEEINNKLDQMAEAGTLQEIITTYIQSNVTWTFETVAEMQQATNFVDGSFARTLGYYTLNDGGGATYYIRNKVPSDVPSTILLEIGDNLVAELRILNNTIHTKQFGIKGDGTTDEGTILNQFFDTYKTYNIVVDHGVYKTSTKLVISGTWRQNTGNNGNRSIEFDNASILYTGAAGTAVLIHSMFKNSIDGLSISEESTSGSKVSIIGCWFNDFSKWFIPSLELTNHADVASGITLVTQSLEYLSFKDITVLGQLRIDTLNDPNGSFINSINFYNCNVSAEGYDYAVVFDGNRAKQAINFYNCDLSYPEVAVFDVAVAQNGKGTVNLIGCYLDSNKPIFHNDNKNNLEFNIVLSTVPATSNEEIFNIKYTDYVRDTIYGGYNGHGYNLALGNINYAMNGDMSSSSQIGGGNALMGDTYGDWAKTEVTTNLSKSGKARKITLQRTATNPHLTVKAITAPRTGEYTAYMRFKVLSGTYDMLTVQFNGVYSGIDSSRIPVGEEVVFMHSKQNIVQAGGSLDFTFHFTGKDISTLEVEFYEVGVTDGKTYIPNAPLHESAKFTS